LLSGKGSTTRGKALDDVTGLAMTLTGTHGQSHVKVRKDENRCGQCGELKEIRLVNLERVRPEDKSGEVHDRV
jgi:hypothetical protein